MAAGASSGHPAKYRSLREKHLTCLAPTAIALAGTVLRVLPWLANYPLHRDEALYGAWARLIASGRDPLLLIPWIDKPPLSIYLGAASIAALGVSELALRLPGLVASILAIPVTYGLARRAYNENIARLAAALLALSPFAILFAPTAFTDPWLTLWLVVASWAALHQRGFIAGLALGLAVASKQQGLLGAPLVLSLLLVPATDGRPLEHTPPRLRRIAETILGFALIFGSLTYWDSLRWHNRPSFWDRSLATYGELNVAAPAEWPARAAEWAEQLKYLFGVPTLSWLILLLAGWAWVRATKRAIGRHHLDQKHLLDLVFGTYVIGYLALHILVTFQPWDRYLLPLAPLVCLLAARGLLSFAGPVSSRSLICKAGLGLALAGALGYAAWLGAAGRLPVGSDHGAYAGITQVTAILHEQPADTIIYHQSLGWYFDFYLFDAPQERRWYPDESKLAAEAARTAETEPARAQWLVLPDWEIDTLVTLRPALAAKKLALADGTQVLRPDGSRSFALYHIAPMASGGAP